MPGCAVPPRRGHHPFEETTQADLAPVADPLGSGGEEPPYPIQRVILASSMPEGFVLDSSSYFVVNRTGFSGDSISWEIMESWED